jgi:hypothetical protein
MYLFLIYMGWLNLPSTITLTCSCLVFLVLNLLHFSLRSTIINSADDCYGNGSWMASCRTIQLTQGILSNSWLAVIVEGADPSSSDNKYQIHPVVIYSETYIIRQMLLSISCFKFVVLLLAINELLLSIPCLKFVVLLLYTPLAVSTCHQRSLSLAHA